MGYPKKEVTTDWGKTIFVEMAPEEYEKALIEFKEKISFFEESDYRMDKEYGSYLRRWFSEENCDGAPFSLKYKWHRLPMGFHQYTFG